MEALLTFDHAPAQHGRTVITIRPTINHAQLYRNASLQLRFSTRTLHETYNCKIFVAYNLACCGVYAIWRLLHVRFHFRLRFSAATSHTFPPLASYACRCAGVTRSRIMAVCAWSGGSTGRPFTGIVVSWHIGQSGPTSPQKTQSEFFPIQSHALHSRLIEFRRHERRGYIL